jgi:tungstate transport system substrate-binding protein
LALASVLFLAVSTARPGTVWAAETTAIKMATTTSTDNSGLLGVLLPAFTKNTGVDVHVIAVGTGKALKLGEQGDVDVVLVHAREAELEFVRQGFGVDRRDVMYNDFVVVGPPSDPANIRGEKSAAEALKKTAAAQATFVSRGDESGTHKKEKEIWAAVGVKPTGPWYLEAGQGMGAVLIMANEKQAYSLADRGTFIAFEEKVDLIVLCEGDSVLANPYGIIAVSPKRHAHVKYKEAMKLIEWITSDEGQDLIAGFKIRDKQLFYPSAR